jgi:hypothetical protein
MRTLILVLAALAASNALAAFKCVDPRGATHIGDTPPPACAGVTTYEVSPSGSVLRTTAPSVASGEAAKTEGEKRRESDRAAAETRRRDRVLLDSYSSAREIELARDRNVDMIKGQIDGADARSRQLDERERELRRAVGASKGGQVPLALRADLESAEREHAFVIGARARYAKELDDTRARFESDRRRWIELREGK